MDGVTHVGSVFEWTGFQLAEVFHNALWSGAFVLLPASIWVGSLIRKMARAIRTQDFEIIPIYIGYSIVVIWLISPVETTYGMVSGSEAFNRAVEQKSIHVPRVLGWMSNIVDSVRDEAIIGVRENLGQSTKDFNRVAALIEDSRIHDPKTRQDLRQFLDACYVPALAKAGQSQAAIRDPGNILFDDGLNGLYADLWLDESYNCAQFRSDFLELLQSNELSQNDYHRYMLQRLEAAEKESNSTKSFRKLYIARLVKNSAVYANRPTLEELDLARVNFNTRWAPMGSGFTDSNLDYSVGPIEVSVPLAGKINIGTGIDNVLKGVARMLTDFFVHLGKYVFGYAVVTHVTALAPAFYGVAVMIVYGVFPLLALFALVSGETGERIAAAYAKMLFSIKLWPVFWAVVETFYNSGSFEDALVGTDKASSAVFVAATMYLLVPTLSFCVVQMCASFGKDLLTHATRTAAAAGTAAGAVVAGGYLRTVANTLSAPARAVRAA